MKNTAVHSRIFGGVTQHVRDGGTGSVCARAGDPGPAWNTVLERQQCLLTSTRQVSFDEIAIGPH